ncbi:MAG: coq1 putative hexaprenyl diphosphate synthase [Watsoniomyces obsoletus]|nr:MAG: coq1 putative hexaprenyl diphosphate synthase [Watsoniomyces obsoletus]
MPPKKSTTAAKPKKTTTPSSHASYKDMIKDAILNLKERNGSSRQALKKYIQANNNINVPSTKTFDSLFNRTLKAGVDSGDFAQPKGPSGPVKLAKKGSKPATTKTATKKTTTAKKETSATKKDAAPKKDKDTTTTTTKKAAASKKEPATKKDAAPKKTKANAAKPRKASTAVSGPVSISPSTSSLMIIQAPAVTDKPTVTNTTKSGRVTKTRAKPEPTKRAPAKKAAAKKATPKRKADAEAAAEAS